VRRWSVSLGDCWKHPARSHRLSASWLPATFVLGSIAFFFTTPVLVLVGIIPSAGSGSLVEMLEQQVSYF